MSFYVNVGMGSKLGAENINASKYWQLGAKHVKQIDERIYFMSLLDPNMSD